MKLTINNISFNLHLLNTVTAEIIGKNLPLSGIVRRFGDEVYFYTDLDLELGPGAKDVFSVGDMVYWRSNKSEKRAIAIFFGNTPVGDGTKPRAVSPASKFAALGKNDVKKISQIKNGDTITITH